jgi:hypothetical protein
MSLPLTDQFAMTEKRESLKEIFLDVEASGTVTERQEEGPSYEPVDSDTAEQEDEAAASVVDGLNEAIDGGISPASTESA